MTAERRKFVAIAPPGPPEIIQAIHDSIRLLVDGKADVLVLPYSTVLVCLGDDGEPLWSLGAVPNLNRPTRFPVLDSVPDGATIIGVQEKSHGRDQEGRHEEAARGGPSEAQGRLEGQGGRVEAAR